MATFDSSFVMTIFFLLLGPIKIIPAFAKITRDAEPSFKRQIAIIATLLATLICTVVALLANNFVAKYQLSIQSVQITGALILLLWALNAIFPRREPSASTSGRTALQVALSPLATPVIVTPAGVAAIMVFVLLAPRTEGGYQTIATALAVVMVLNFLIMFFNDWIVRLPGLLSLLQLLGSVLIVVQMALAVEVLLDVFTGTGLISRG